MLFRCEIQFVTRHAILPERQSREYMHVPRVGETIRIGADEWIVDDVTWEDPDEKQRWAIAVLRVRNY